MNNRTAILHKLNNSFQKTANEPEDMEQMIGNGKSSPLFRHIGFHHGSNKPSILEKQAGAGSFVIKKLLQLAQTRPGRYVAGETDALKKIISTWPLRSTAVISAGAGGTGAAVQTHRKNKEMRGALAQKDEQAAIAQAQAQARIDAAAATGAPATDPPAEAPAPAPAKAPDKSPAEGDFLRDNATALGVGGGAGLGYLASKLYGGATGNRSTGRDIASGIAGGVGGGIIGSEYQTKQAAEITQSHLDGFLQGYTYLRGR